MYIISLLLHEQTSTDACKTVVTHTQLLTVTSQSISPISGPAQNFSSLIMSLSFSSLLLMVSILIWPPMRRFLWTLKCIP